MPRQLKYIDKFKDKKKEMERDRKTERDIEISTLFTRFHTVSSRHPAISSTSLISVRLACHNIIHRFDNHEL